MNVYNTPDMNKFRPGISKMQSLDFTSDMQAVKDGFDRRAMEAKLYRMNTLQALDEKKGSNGKDGLPSKETKKSKGKDDDKASFGQCVFNMSNILMVRGNEKTILALRHITYFIAFLF